MSVVHLKAPRSGVQIFVDTLEELGVEYIFGYPGGAVLPLFDILNKTKFKVILSGDERCAGHEAEGYARATGKVGVCLATSGPGSTNLVTPLADAKMDSVGIVGITGQVSSPLIGLDAFQECPIQNVTMQITKHNYLVTDTADIARVLHEAFYIASTGRPGPVLVDLTKDAQQKHIEQYDKTFQLRGYNPVRKLNLKQIEIACQALEKAKKPFLYGGQGLIQSNATEELLKFMDKAQLPIGLTLLALGCVPSSHPLYMGMLGMHGTGYANFAIHEADLVIVLGARFDDRVTGNPKEFIKNAKIIHVDIDPAEINKVKTADIPITGDVKEALIALTHTIKKCHRPEWIAHVEGLKKKYDFGYKKSGEEIKPQYFIERLSEITKGKAVVTTGVGQHQMWAAQFYQFEKPRSFITSGGAGTMGFGLPSAVGAKFGRPKDLVIDIDGDGSLEMNLNELRVLSDHNLGVKVCLLNNKTLGMPHQWQRILYNGNYSSTEFGDYPDFTNGIKALYGISTRSVTKPEEVDDAIHEMLKDDKPFVLEVRIPKLENVMPMIPAGGTIEDILFGK